MGSLSFVDIFAMIVVSEYLFPRSFWIMTTGLGPDCSDPMKWSVLSGYIKNMSPLCISIFNSPVCYVSGAHPWMIRPFRCSFCLTAPLGLCCNITLWGDLTAVNTAALSFDGLPFRRCVNYSGDSPLTQKEHSGRLAVLYKPHSFKLMGCNTHTAFCGSTLYPDFHRPAKMASLC